MVKEVILSGRIAREVFDLDPTLFRILKEEILPLWPVDELVVTSIHRTDAENKAAGAQSQIHVVGPPYRALDLRIRNIADTPEEAQKKCEEICEFINKRWEYDPTRPTMVVAYGQVHGTGSHAHIQVHNNTRKRDA